MPGVEADRLALLPADPGEVNEAFEWEGGYTAREVEIGVKPALPPSHRSAAPGRAPYREGSVRWRAAADSGRSWAMRSRSRAPFL